ncbi:MAG: response regulator [Lachnospiraceae bacterium]|jgi:signal transduction histidine kinase|nr:response regulator [Lachnospiraceae bacterium]
MHKDILAKMLDSLIGVGIYVIERETHRILYLNEYVKKTAKCVEVGMICHEIWTAYCATCPIKSLESQSSDITVHYNDEVQDYYSIMASQTDWGGVPAYAIVMVPYRFVSEDQVPWLPQAREAYVNSISILLNECMMINLTENFFVTCQVGGVGLEMSDRQPYGIQVQEYFEQVIHPQDIKAFQETFSKEALFGLLEQDAVVKVLRVRRMSEYETYHVVEYTASRVDLYGSDELWCVLSCKDIHDQVLMEQKKNMEISQLAMAAKAVYKTLIAINVTQETYEILANETIGLLNVEPTGRMKDLIKTHLLSIHPDDRMEFQTKFSKEKLIKSFETGEDLIYIELRQKNEKGEYIWTSTQMVRVPNHYSDDLLAVCMCRSIDAERRHQEEERIKEQKAKEILVEALEKAKEASAAKSEFLSKVSHDIRTPLNAIIGMTTLAQANMGEFLKLTNYLANIKLSGEHLLGLVNEVLDMNSIESGTVELVDEYFDLQRMIQDVVAMVQTRVLEKEQNLCVTVNETLSPVVLGDEQRLRQVLVTVLENASKYSNSHSTIRFCTMELPSDNAQIGKYQFVIEDDGIGMTQEFVEHIFEPFARAKDTRINKVAGTGLGLTIAHNIISMMGGEMKVESEVQKGSRFTILVDLEKKQAQDRNELIKPRRLHGDFAQMKILVVEDNEMNQEIMEEMILLTGAKVTIVGDGREAYETVQQYPADYFDLILMDIRMPGANGYETTEMIRALPIPGIHELPIIALTADAFKDDIKKAKIAGMNGHVAKPITLAKLKEILEYCRIWGQDRTNFPFYEETTLPES